MPVTSRPHTSGSKGHPADLLSGLHCAWTQLVPTKSQGRGIATRQRSMPTRPPNGPHWQPWNGLGLRSDPQLKIAIALGKMACHTLLLPGPRPERQGSIGPSVRRLPPDTPPDPPDVA
jgi:hypothetical protein